MNFADGATTAEIRLPIQGDTVFEANENFALTLSNATGGAATGRATATGADALDVDILAGALLHAVTVKDAATKEGWRKAGAAFFLGKAAGLRADLLASKAALSRSTAARHRL